jgi:hypothetical protein
LQEKIVKILKNIFLRIYSDAMKNMRRNK